MEMTPVYLSDWHWFFLKKNLNICRAEAIQILWQIFFQKLGATTQKACFLVKVIYEMGHKSAKFMYLG